MEDLKVYKEKQYLIFDFYKDGKKVKYDFAKKQAIGFSGKPVIDLKRQLSGISMEDVINSCTDEKYGRFLNFIKKNEWQRNISNIGTILESVPNYSNYEQLFSAGIYDIIDNKYHFKYTINDIPKSLIKVAKEYELSITNDFVKYYKKNIDNYYLAFNLDYISLSKKEVYNILSYSYNYWGAESCVSELINNYHYNIKPLMLYFDFLSTFEAIDVNQHFIHEFYDYVTMMSAISKKYDKYPRNFLTTHCIACRTYNRLKKDFEEKLFQNRINKNLEYTYENYAFIYPDCTQDIKDEACMQSNCVASYIQRVIDGHCHIMFMRNKNDLKHSLVTLEIRNNKIVQARGKYNREVTESEQKAIDMWNKKFNKTTLDK